MADIQSAAAEIRRGKKRTTKPDKNITSASTTQGGHKKVMQVWSRRMTSDLEMEHAIFMAHQEKRASQHRDNSTNSKSLYNQPLLVELLQAGPGRKEYLCDKWNSLFRSDVLLIQPTVSKQ